MAAVTKSEQGGDFPASAYAYVPDPEKPSTWKLLLWDSPDGKMSAAQVGRAIAALGPGGFRGNPVEIPEKNLSEVKAKVRAAWKKANPDKQDADMPEAIKAAEPTAGDVHVPTTDPQPQNQNPPQKKGRKEATRAFLAKLKELIRGKVKDGDLSEEDFNQAIKQARSHAGGMARSQTMKSQMDQQMDKQMPQGACEPMGMMADDMELELDETPRLEKADKRVQYRKCEDPSCCCKTCRFHVPASNDCYEVEGDCEPDCCCNLWTEPLQAFGEPGPDHVTDIADLAMGQCGWRLFVESRHLSEAPDWIPYLPMPGVYEHHRWGNIVISRERNQRFVENFKAKVYQDRLPLDAEHETKLSGAMGWITDMRLNPDGSADAFVEWTDRGRFMLREDRFRYVSPEWYDDWADPATGKAFKDVCIGGALTTRPFFKDKSLRPLVANEQGLFALPGDGTAAPGAGTITFNIIPIKKEEPMSGQNPSPVGMTEEQVRAFAEMQQKITALEAERTEAKQAAEKLSTELKTATEQVAKLNQEACRKRFTDEVLGKGTESGVRWYGEVEKHVAFMEKLAEKFGEDSQELLDYIQEHRATAEQLRQTNLFKEMGREGSGTASAQDKINTMTRELQAKNPSMKFAEAYTQVITENPKLYEEYLVEHPAQIKGLRE